tara:strand:+ start:944 stop:1048 length:105 start_codon:yes stop_codon:yes gene_type:complete
VLLLVIGDEVIIYASVNERQAYYAKEPVERKIDG